MDAQADLKARYGGAALVTGASDGIGEAFARNLARAGFDLILVARRQERLEALANELAQGSGVRATPLAADLSGREGVAATLAETAKTDIGLFVAAAGFGASGNFVDNDIADELDMLDVNCRAVLQMTHAFARRFIARGRGGIVLMGSLLGFQGVARAANYAATKAYIQTLVEGLRPELKPKGVDIISVAPGPVRSGFAARAKMDMGAAARPDEVPGPALEALGRATTTRPGALSKLLEASMTGLPRRARSAILGRVMAGMTKAQ